MEKSLKHDLIKKIILIENLLLLLMALMSPVMFFSGFRVGYAICVISSYVLYPLILITFLTGEILKAIKIRDYKLNLIFFGVNIVLSLASFLVVLYAVARALVDF